MEQTSTLQECPNCGSKIKPGGLFKQNKLVDDSVTRLINEFSTNKPSAHCETCFMVPYGTAKEKRLEEIKRLKLKSQDLLNTLMIVSIPAPLNWDYEVLGIVTGQSTTGTGIFAEFASSFTDLFGAQSGTYNTKLQHGEQLCMTQLRLKCMALGGNAIIGADIDYSEVGGDKGMLMVCMTGTAVKLKNIEVLGNGWAQSMVELQKITEKISYLTNLYTPPSYN